MSKSPQSAFHNSQYKFTLDFSGLELAKPETLDEARWSEQENTTYEVVKLKILSDLFDNCADASFDYPRWAASHNKIPVTATMKSETGSIDKMRARLHKNFQSMLKNGNKIARELHAEGRQKEIQTPPNAAPIRTFSPQQD